MSDPVLAQKDPSVVLAEALERFRQETGQTLQPADPRRLFLQTFVLLLAQQRQLIDFSGKQSLLRFVSDEWIDDLAELWGERRLAPRPSTCTMRFVFSEFSTHTVPTGTRVTDGVNIWSVIEGNADIVDTTPGQVRVEAEAACTVTGSATNGVVTGQIVTLVDPAELTGLIALANVSITSGGRDLETLEDFRARLRDVPESRSTCGPRNAYRAAALETSPTVADAVALGPDDGAEVAAYAPDPGEVFVLIIKGTRDASGVLTSVVPAPDAGLIDDVEEALSAEDVRPLSDFVTVMAPAFVEFDAIVSYYISRSRQKQASEIQEAVEEAFEAYLLWQQAAIGRDINPSELIARLMAAGAKRVVVTEPSFSALMRDQSARLSYSALVFSGIEDD